MGRESTPCSRARPRSGARRRRWGAVTPIDGRLRSSTGAHSSGRSDGSGGPPRVRSVRRDGARPVCRLGTPGARPCGDEAGFPWTDACIHVDPPCPSPEPRARRSRRTTPRRSARARGAPWSRTPERRWSSGSAGTLAACGSTTTAARGPRRRPWARGRGRWARASPSPRGSTHRGPRPAARCWLTSWPTWCSRSARAPARAAARPRPRPSARPRVRPRAGRWRSAAPIERRRPCSPPTCPRTWTARMPRSSPRATKTS